MTKSMSVIYNSISTTKFEMGDGPFASCMDNEIQGKHTIFKGCVKKNEERNCVTVLLPIIGNASVGSILPGPIKVSLRSTLDVSQDISENLQIEPLASVNHTNWVKCSGVEYRVGLYVCTHVDESGPVFGKISSIVL